ncbi:MAG: glycosyltransferase [Christensenellales bacterium]|jgi:glycosyltransferase involved in cell wall biosynthesis
MEKTASLCLCMIVKDERKHIERCIRSVRGLAREIVVVDTGSTDNTVALARSLGADVYTYAWDDSFANARNFAMDKAQSDWLLLLDADEALDEGGHEVILKFIADTRLDGAHFRVRNYTGSRYSPEAYSLHSALRLLRNNKKYRYKGEIHEQITCVQHDEKISDRFTTLDVTVHHFGYLDDTVKEKRKRRRNIPILEKQLEKNPTEPFTLFNMGNEYLSMHEYETALEYYEKALSHIENRRIAFVPHLFFRMVNCYESLGKPERALGIIRMGLAEYPSCTDYEYLRADILCKRRRYTLAIESLETCLKMGKPPMPLEFLPGCGTYRAAYQLGEVYLELEDYVRAVRYFDLALTHKPNLYAALYRSGAALNRLYADKDQVKEKLFAYFGQPKYAPNALVGADILIGEGLYPQALEALEDLTDTKGRQTQIAYVRGRALFYRRQFDEALPLLQEVCDSPEPEGKILGGIRPAGAKLLFAGALMRGDEALMDRALAHIKDHCGQSEYAAASLMKGIFLEIPQEDPRYEDEGKAELAAMLRILDMFVKCHHFDLFEKMLRSLNYVDSKEVLLRLAQLYDDNHLGELAAQYVLRSIKELDYIDAWGAGVLFRQILSPIRQCREPAHTL